MAEESKGFWGTISEATGADKLFGSLGAIGSYLATSDNPDIPDISYQVDPSLFETNQADSLFESMFNEIQSEQTFLGQVRQGSLGALRRQGAMIDAMVAERGSFRDMPSQAQLAQKQALTQSLQNAASLSATIGGANAGLNQMNLQNRMAENQLKIAEQGAQLSLDEQMQREQMEFNRDRGILDAMYQAGQLNLSGLGGSRQGIGGFGQVGLGGARLGANIKGNLQGARERYDDAVMGRYNAEVQKDIREDQQINQMIGGVTDSIAGDAPNIAGYGDSRVKKK